MEFTSLEKAVLEAICDAREDRALRTMIETAVVTSRDNTGHGFFTYFDTDPALGPITGDAFIDGPIIHVAHMGEGMMLHTILHMKDDRPECLEGYQFGDVDLNKLDLATLTFTRLEWFEALG